MRKPKQQWFYFLNRSKLGGYRAKGCIADKATALTELGQFVAAKKPDYFTPAGWEASARYQNIEDFQASLDAGALVRVTLLAACAALNADVVLFAPTLSSRIASKKQK